VSFAVIFTVARNRAHIFAALRSIYFASPQLSTIVTSTIIGSVKWRKTSARASKALANAIEATLNLKRTFGRKARSIFQLTTLLQKVFALSRRLEHS
jgi:hypothetical protein